MIKFVFIYIIILNCLNEAVVLMDYSYYKCASYKIENGRLRMKPKGKLVRFQCNKGYQLVGEKYNYCTNGKFDVRPPICVKPSCDIPAQISNGYIHKTYNGAVLHFFCKPGFTLRGQVNNYCNGVKWINYIPICISTHMPTPTSCDFETEDLCGWTQDLYHDNDWKRHNFNRSMGHVDVGPTHDHTKGINSDGFYMYSDSSTKLENETARLISPVYSKMLSGACFMFYYHMHRDNVGQLKVYIQKESEKFESIKPVFMKVGNQGDSWRKGIITIDSINDDFQIIIESVRGSNYYSDIAIDDVELRESCPEEEIITTTDLITFSKSETYGTCANHCNKTFDFDPICECRDGCHEENTCCPDYIFYCLIEYYDKTSEESSTDTSTDYTIIEEITEKDLQYNETLPTIEATQNVVKNYTTTIDITPVTATSTSTIPTTIEIINSNSVINRIIIFSPINTSTTKTPGTTILPDTTERIYSSTFTTVSEYSETVEIETDYDLPNMPTMSNITEIKAQRILQSEKSNDTNLSVIIFCSGALILVTLTIPLIIYIYKKVNCNKFRYRSSGNRESMSDVRFIASDEVLDFTWQTLDN